MVDAVGAVGTATTTGLVQDALQARGTQPTDGSGFGQLVQQGLESVSQAEFAADAAVQDLATGGPTTIEDVMVATTQAQLSVELLARVRDRALTAYQEIMRMPL